MPKHSRIILSTSMNASSYWTAGTMGRIAFKRLVKTVLGMDILEICAKPIVCSVQRWAAAKCVVSCYTSNTHKQKYLKKKIAMTILCTCHGQKGILKHASNQVLSLFAKITLMW